jgi:hypothetical protein
VQARAGHVDETALRRQEALDAAAGAVREPDQAGREERQQRQYE